MNTLTRFMPFKLCLATAALSLVLGSAAAMADTRIGVSMSSFDDNYLTTVRQDLAAKAKADGVQVQFEDANNDIVRQISQIQNFIAQNVDAVIVTPVDTASTKNIIDAAVKAKVPLVFMNRRPDQPKLPEGVVSVTSDDKEAGRLQAEYIAKKLDGKGQVAILLGELSNNSTHARTAGVKEVLAKYPGIKIVDEQTGLWLRQKGMDLTSDWLTAGKPIDAILSNNDEMGIGAAMALKSGGKAGTPVGGVDGTTDGLASIKRGDLTVSVFQDAKGQAEGSLAAAMKMINKQPAQDVLIPYRLITKDNVAEFQAMSKP